MKDKPKVALSGASGAIGTVLRPRLVERGIDLRSAGGSKPLQALSAAEEVMHGDLRDPAVVVDVAVAAAREVVHDQQTAVPQHLLVVGAVRASTRAPLLRAGQRPAGKHGSQVA